MSNPIKQKSMENVLLAKKSWSNACAFVSMNPETGSVHVYGTFRDTDGYRHRSHGGPITEILGIVPENLMLEAKEDGRCWGTAKSPELSEFCEKIFAKAKEVEPWFGY